MHRVSYKSDGPIRTHRGHATTQNEGPQTILDELEPFALGCIHWPTIYYMPRYGRILPIKRPAIFARTAVKCQFS